MIIIIYYQLQLFWSLMRYATNTAHFECDGRNDAAMCLHIGISDQFD